MNNRIIADEVKTANVFCQTEDVFLQTTGQIVKNAVIASGAKQSPEIKGSASVAHSPVLSLWRETFLPSRSSLGIASKAHNHAHEWLFLNLSSSLVFLIKPRQTKIVIKGKYKLGTPYRLPDFTCVATLVCYSSGSLLDLLDSTDNSFYFEFGLVWFQDELSIEFPENITEYIIKKAETQSSIQ